MSWLGSLTPGNVLRNFLSYEPDPHKVLDVKSKSYSEKIIHCREDAIVLYGPTQDKYEIVLHRPCSETLHQAFSLYRTTELHDAELTFLQLKDKVPLLVDISREVCNINGIQKMCDLLRDQPSWSIAHVAAHFALLDCFTHPLVLSCLNSSDPSTGISPLQVAIGTGSLRAVQTLVNAQASLEHIDKEGNSVFHYAAESSKDIIMALCAESTKCLNMQNSIGYTPLHRACLADKPECVKALLRAGADVNISATRSALSPGSSTTPPGYVGDFLQGHPNKLHAQDMKFGGTPLHWSCSREVINTLIDMGCHINALNFVGRTALHMMVFRNRLDCVVALLSHNADINVADKDGDTALHLAVRHGTYALVQALVVFGANLMYRNNKGETPRHCISPDARGERILYILHSVGAPRCSLTMNGCSDGCIASEKEHNGTKGGRLLCLDGGGIRGLVLIQLLLELEKETACPIVHCFDWLAGTSTGGILALGLASGKTLKECLCLYFRLKDIAFIGGRPYSSEPLENILKETLGTDTVMADIKHPKLLITGVLADRKPVALHLFRNYESPAALLKVDTAATFKPPPKPHEQLIWRAARATGAAPSYFRAFGRFLDGGLIANNPTLDALTEIHEYNLALEACGRSREARAPTVVVSLGTGMIPVSQLREIDVFRPESLWDTARLAIGISALGTLLVDQATASDGRVVDRARAWCSMIGVPYYRFSPQMSEEIGMDEKSDEKLVNMMWESKAYMHSHRCILQELATLLTSHSSR
ncbi:Transient receptor potential channel pyrexia [Gryllus bimaculatus]|nr:Transient receptor potential channel pyrexia [Gryllus bimaculatus]